MSRNFQKCQARRHQSAAKCATKILAALQTDRPVSEAKPSKHGVWMAFVRLLVCPSTVSLNHHTTHGRTAVAVVVVSHQPQHRFASSFLSLGSPVDPVDLAAFLGVF